MTSYKGETALDPKKAESSKTMGSENADDDKEKGRTGPCSDRIKGKFTVGVGEEWDLSVKTEVEGEGKQAVGAFTKVIYLFGFVAILGFAAYIITILN